MFQVRWRWPILASLAAGLGYGSQFYTIGGLEHLHLQSKTAGANPTAKAVSPSGFDDFGQEFNTDVAKGFAPAERATEWRERLSSGEKIALWKTQAEVSSVKEVPENAAALATAIVAPPDFVSPDNVLQQPARTQTSPNIARLSGQQNYSASAKQIQPLQTRQAPGRLSTARGQQVDNSNLDSPNSYSFGRQSPINRGPPPPSTTIRIASFQTDGIDGQKLSQAAVARTYLEILSRFDVIALQGVTSQNDAWLSSLVANLNHGQQGTAARHYDYLLGPEVGRSVPKRRFAFIYNSVHLETDPKAVYTPADPQDLVEYEPLVAWFRCRQAPPAQAFTFSLVSAQLNEVTAEQELNLLPQLIQAIERDGRQEDDWIIAGDFAGRVRSILDIDRSIRLALPVLPTDISGTSATDSMLFSAAATIEFAEQSGVYDFLRRHNLSVEQAAMVSDHLPVWADFSIFEGGVSSNSTPNTVFTRAPTH